ncbi:hypothetical protein T492DRAFT_1109482, partial [Pavlovales sp. CCMP2436]
PKNNSPEHLPKNNSQEHLPKNNSQHLPKNNSQEHLPKNNSQEHLPKNNIFPKTIVKNIFQKTIVPVIIVMGRPFNFALSSISRTPSDCNWGDVKINFYKKTRVGLQLYLYGTWNPLEHALVCSYICMGSGTP